MTTETTETTRNELDVELALALGEALELAADTVSSWIGDHVSVEVHDQRSQNGGRFFAAEYMVDGEVVAVGFDKTDRYEAQRLATKSGRAWVLREVFPGTAHILSSHADLLLRLV